jgi:hypothetical protein
VPPPPSATPAAPPSESETPTAPPLSTDLAPPAAAPAALVPAVPVPAAVAPPASPPAEPADAWPIEYVLRPQTLPSGQTEVAFTSHFFQPEAVTIVSAGGATTTFHANLSLGLLARHGVTDRFEVEFSAPKVLCFARSDPSGCDSLNRINGTGMSGVYGVVRTQPVQLEIYGRISVFRSSEPVSLGWNLGTRTKLLFGRIVALEMALSFSRSLDTPPPGADAPLAGFVVDANLQLTRHLLLFADLDPYAPADHLSTIAMAAVAGGSWTFASRAEIHMTAEVLDVLPRRSWQANIFGNFYALSVRFWL